MSEHTRTRFRITYTKGAYYVSIPNYEGGEVVAATVADALVDALESLDVLLDFGDEELEPIWTFEDVASIQAAFKKAHDALALIRDPVGAVGVDK